MKIPLNASRLIALRKRREVPELPVLVSFAGSLEFTNTTLLAVASEDYDWRCLTGLEVEVFVSNDTAFAAVLRHLAAIAAVVPSRMILTFIEGPRVECGEWRVVPHPDGDFMLFDWFPIGVGPRFYGDAQAVVRKLVRELGKALPIPFDRATDLLFEIARERACA